MVAALLRPQKPGKVFRGAPWTGFDAEQSDRATRQKMYFNFHAT
jgi:hypothetical protein